jgi:beta-phosphoglucomutase-like phosphatase (HAD superfamily)
MIYAILYDLDGVLVSAVKIHQDAFNAALQEVAGFTLSNEEHERDFNGLPTKDKIDLLMKQGRLENKFSHKIAIPLIKQKKTVEAIHANLKFDEQKVYLHRWAKSMGYPIGCVTNCSRETARLMLEITGQLPYLDLLITNDMGFKPKPDPEVYLEAINLLKLKPEQVLIVEDSPKGIQAALATGAKVWQVNGPEEVLVNNLIKQICE